MEEEKREERRLIVERLTREAAGKQAKIGRMEEREDEGNRTVIVEMEREKDKDKVMRMRVELWRR